MLLLIFCKTSINAPPPFILGIEQCKPVMLLQSKNIENAVSLLNDRSNYPKTDMFPQISFNENYDLDAHLGAHYLKHMAYLSSL